MPESMDERIAREKREKYEASDEYKQLQADKARDAANIELASGSQLSDADIASQSQKNQGDTTEQARQWIADVTGLPVEGDLGDALKSGVLLCEVVNKVKPGHIKKISKSAMPFPQRENIKAWTDAARDVFGVPDRDNFDTGDLFEQSNMKQVVFCILSAGRASASVAGYSGPTITTAGSAKKAAGRDRSKSKVSQLGGGLKLNLGGPPPAEPGSMEWLRQQKAAETGGGGGGGSIKARGLNLAIPLGMPPGMSPRTPMGGGGGGGAATPLSDETATPKLSAHPTSARASRGKRQAATRRPRGKRGAGRDAKSEKPDSTPTAETPTATTPAAAAATPRRSVNAAPPGAFVLPMLGGEGSPKLKSVTATPSAPSPASTPKSVNAAPPGALVLPKLGGDGDTPKSASEFFPRTKVAAAAAADSPTEKSSSKAQSSSPPAGALVLPSLPAKKGPPSLSAKKLPPKPAAKPKFVPPEGIDPDLTLMYELADGESSEEIGLEALQDLVDSGDVGEDTRVWTDGMEDWAVFGGASWRFGHGERTLIYESSDEEPSEEIPMARVQEMVTDGLLNGATRMWTDGMDEWSNLSEMATWLALVGVETVEDNATGAVATTFIYDTDGDGTPSEEVGVDQIDALMEAGTIEDSTMVWSDGWDDWLSLGEAKAKLIAGGTTATTFIYDTDGDGTPSEEVGVDQIDALMEAGTLSDETMIWSDGWDDWLSLGEAKETLRQADSSNA